jgi:hypothetical protein
MLIEIVIKCLYSFRIDVHPDQSLWGVDLLIERNAAFGVPMAAGGDSGRSGERHPDLAVRPARSTEEVVGSGCR